MRANRIAIAWLLLGSMAALQAAPPAADPVAASDWPAELPRRDDPQPAFTRFRRFGTEQGLTQVSALAIAQDRHGFVWIATQDGLNRFDGYEFRRYQAGAAPGGLQDDRINALQLDRDGGLWAGSRGGLVRYLEAEDRFERLAVAGPAAARPGEEDIRVLLIGADGQLWVGSHGGLLQLAAGGRSLQRMPPAPELRIESLAEDRDGRIWLGTLGGLYRFDPASGRYDQPHLAASGADAGLAGRIDALAFDADGALWIGAIGAGVYRYVRAAVEDSGGRLSRYRHAADDPASLGSDHVRSMLFDRDGRFWIGHREGLDLVVTHDPQRLQVHRFSHLRHDQRSLGNGRVMSLFEDAAGSLWIGTFNGGVSLLARRSNRFAAYGSNMRDPVVHSLGAAGAGALWVGSRNGLYRFDSESGELRLLDGSDGLAVGAITADDGTIWLGASVGLARINGDGRFADVDGLPETVATARVTALRAEPDALWLGTYDRGLIVLARDGPSVRAVHPTRSWISTIDRYSPALILACGSDGLHWFDGDDGRRVFRHRSGGDDAPLPAGGITAFLRARDGRQWLASAGGGLLQMHLADADDPASARFEAFPTRQPLASNVLHAILEDRHGMLWLATARGLSRLDPDSGAVDNFDSADGAFDSDYGSAAAVALAGGVLAFGAREGFVVFDPDRIGPARSAPAPLLTELRLWNRPLAPSTAPKSPLPRPLHLLDTPLRLPAAQARMLGLRFAAADFVAPQRLRYAYRLDGFDADWIEVAASERSATYTNLPAGDYLFRVRAGETAEELADAPETRLALQILPPWWLTWWAQGLAMALVLGGLLGLHRLRLRGTERRRRILERQVAERTGELSAAKERAESALQQLQGAQRQLVEAEKMASLGQLVAGIAHEINTPIGIAVTAASHLHERGGDIANKLGDGRLTRSELAEWNRLVDEAMRMILASLERAHALIGSFKQVAVDQSSEQRRRFDLAVFLGEVRFALQPSFRRSGHSLGIDCPPGIVLDTYPGALFRIMTNWVNNSLLHGLAGRDNGRMAVSAREDGDWVELHYHDDGAGMVADVARRAFDPFFTTRRGSGGSGLGLHLVYNLATRLLGGSITLETAPGAGTRFVLRIPKRAPERAASVEDRPAVAVASQDGRR
jgi:ligand-binding sensor domain-containing protein/signal transduction histidine kinase